jgi:hypothetical protein
MSLIAHAKSELLLAGYIPLDQEQEDGPNKWVQENILSLLEVFAEQGHSGSSAPYVINMFTKLAAFDPLTPLTGSAEEWVDHGDGCFQNKRMSTVFKNGIDGEAYNIDGKVFWHWDWIIHEGEAWPTKFKSSYTSGDSRTPVVFPYTKAPVEYVHRSEEDIFYPTKQAD